MKTLRLMALATTLIAALYGCSKSDDKSGAAPEPPTPPRPLVVAKYAYVLNQGDQSISQYTIGNDGTLTPMTQAVVATGQNPTSMVMTVNQNFLYVADGSDDTISAYSIDKDSGQLSALGSPIHTGEYPLSLNISKDGKYLYSVNQSDNNISQYQINTDGSLVLATTIPNPGLPAAIGFSASGKYAYVTNVGDQTISQYEINADGTWGALNPATVPAVACSGPVAMAQVNQSEFLYAVSCHTDELLIFNIESNGTLTQKPSATTGQSPQNVMTAGSAVYVTNTDGNSVSVYSINTDGSLAGPASVGAGDMPEAMAVDLGRGIAYLTDYSMDQITQYQVAGDGSLKARSAVSATATGSLPIQILLK